ncbi:hypothetical protein YWS52_19720 [Chitiniphilus shinanonensis]
MRLSASALPYQHCNASLDPLVYGGSHWIAVSPTGIQIDADRGRQLPYPTSVLVTQFTVAALIPSTVPRATTGRLASG